MQNCHTCNLTLPAENFSMTGAKSYLCKTCWRERNKVYNHSASSKWHNTRQSAEKRGLEFQISKEEFSKLLTLPCAYGSAIHNENGLHVGLDRKDNMVGYIATNCVPCCGKHNIIKNDWFTYEQMLEIVQCHPLLQICGNASSGRKCLQTI